jgi:tetratricopeptide (TPR) repeat protein
VPTIQRHRRNGFLCDDFNHPDIAASYFNISLVHCKQGDSEKAIKCLKESLAIELHSLPANHPDLAKTYDTLAGALYEQKKFKEALESMMKCYEINSTYLSPDHPEIIDNLDKICFFRNSYERWRRSDGVQEKSSETITSLK